MSALGVRVHEERRYDSGVSRAVAAVTLLSVNVVFNLKQMLLTQIKTPTNAKKLG